MAVKAILTKAEYEGDGDLQEHYVPRENVENEFVLDVTKVGSFALEDVGGLRSALGKEREKAGKLSGKLDKFKGIEDPEAALAAIAKLAELDDLTGDDRIKALREELEGQFAKKFDSDRSKLAAKHGEEIATVTKDRDGLMTQLQSALIDNSVKDAVSTAKGNQKLLSLPIRQHVRLVRGDDNGELKVRIVDADGQERISLKPGVTDPMTIGELVEEFRADKDYASAFEGSGATGSGATGSGQSHPTGSVFRLTPEDAKDPAKYRAAKANAEKAGSSLVIE